MLKIIAARIRQGFRTIKFPSDKISLPERYRGKPKLLKNEDEKNSDKNSIDLGNLLFNEDIKKTFPFQYSGDYRMAVTRREDLIIKDGEEFKLATALKEEILKILGQSLKLRAVSAGSCNACDMDMAVLNTVVFDLSRFGIDFVASPRHADGLIITGPVTQNMKIALLKTYEAVAEPKIVIALGACAIDGGPFKGSKEVNNGADKILPVDLYIPGCPPHPLTILDGLLRLIGKIKDKK